MNKNTDQLLIRLDPMTKKAFIKACRVNDTNASRHVRKLIREYVKENNHNLLIDI
jgi:hypothetical protein